MNPSDVVFVTGCLAAHPDRRGGQHVARQCTAVLAIHNPTGCAFRSDSERSQFKNKENALAQLAEIVKFALRAKERRS